MANINVRITDAAFAKIVNATKQSVTVSRPNKNNPQVLADVETFEASIFPNSGQNRLETVGTIVSNASHIMFPINNSSAIEKGDRITDASGDFLFVQNVNKINNITWIDCEEEAV